MFTQLSENKDILKKLIQQVGKTNFESKEFEELARDLHHKSKNSSSFIQSVIKITPYLSNTELFCLAQAVMQQHLADLSAPTAILGEDPTLSKELYRACVNRFKLLEVASQTESKEEKYVIPLELQRLHQLMARHFMKDHDIVVLANQEAKKNSRHSNPLPHIQKHAAEATIKSINSFLCLMMDKNDMSVIPNTSLREQLHSQIHEHVHSILGDVKPLIHSEPTSAEDIQKRKTEAEIAVFKMTSAEMKAYEESSSKRMQSYFDLCTPIGETMKAIFLKCQEQLANIKKTTLTEYPPQISVIRDNISHFVLLWDQYIKSDHTALTDLEKAGQLAEEIIKTINAMTNQPFISRAKSTLMNDPINKFLPALNNVKKASLAKDLKTPSQPIDKGVETLNKLAKTIIEKISYPH